MSADLSQRSRLTGTSTLGLHPQDSPFLSSARFPNLEVGSSQPRISAQGEITGSGIDPASGIGPLGTRLLYEFAS